jgi:hypothetical protein
MTLSILRNSYGAAMDNVKLAASLRSLASKLRQSATEAKKEHVEKCAHVLIAANGLAHLKAIITGTEK